MKQSIYDLSIQELSEWLGHQGQKPFRAKQVFEWVYHKSAAGFGAMTNLPGELRTILDGCFSIGPLQPLQVSEGLDATKLLLTMPTGGQVECVRIKMGNTYTACLSTQVGCSVQCIFCATGQMECERSLSAGEIIRQLITVRARGGQVSNVVFMGMGEPFMNYANLVGAIRRMVDKQAFAMSPSRITVSTAGIVPMIRKYAREGIPTELTISLNAPNDELRKRLMPGVAAYLVDEIAQAAKEYSQATGGQPVTFAYVLIDGVNDSLDHAREVAGLLRRQPHHLNVIPLNPVSHANLKRPSKQRTQAFVHHCRKFGLNVSLRKSKGTQIDAACGQLRTRATKKAG